MPSTEKIKSKSIQSMIGFLRIGKPKKKKQPGNPPEAPAVAEDRGGLEEQWFHAVKGEDTEKIKEILERGIDPNVKDEHGWAALHLAAWNGCVSTVTTLLTTPGLAIDLPGPGTSTALSLASQQGHADVVKLLLGNGPSDPACPDVNHHATLGDHGHVTPLHLAAQHGHAATCRLLLAAGARVNAAMETHGTLTGVTPLHLAVQSDHVDVMDVLLEAGADVQSSTQPTAATTAATTAAANTETTC